LFFLHTRLWYLSNLFPNTTSCISTICHSIQSDYPWQHKITTPRPLSHHI